MSYSFKVTSESLIVFDGSRIDAIFPVNNVGIQKRYNGLQITHGAERIIIPFHDLNPEEFESIDFAVKNIYQRMQSYSRSVENIVKGLTGGYEIDDTQTVYKVWTKEDLSELSVSNGYIPDWQTVYCLTKYIDNSAGDVFFLNTEYGQQIQIYSVGEQQSVFERIDNLCFTHMDNQILHFGYGYRFRLKPKYNSAQLLQESDFGPNAYQVWNDVDEQWAFSSGSVTSQGENAPLAQNIPGLVAGQKYMIRFKFQDNGKIRFRLGGNETVVFPNKKSDWQTVDITAGSSNTLIEMLASDGTINVSNVELRTAIY